MWQPIETAPKVYGCSPPAKILGYCPDIAALDGRPFDGIILMWWVGSGSWGYWCAPNTPLPPEPTHWHPLPNPPVTPSDPARSHRPASASAQPE
jgi:hypothetical protein